MKIKIRRERQQHKLKTPDNLKSQYSFLALHEVPVNRFVLDWTGNFVIRPNGAHSRENPNEVGCATYQPNGAGFVGFLSKWHPVRLDEEKVKEICESYQAKQHYATNGGNEKRRDETMKRATKEAVQEHIKESKELVKRQAARLLKAKKRGDKVKVKRWAASVDAANQELKKWEGLLKNKLYAGGGGSAESKPKPKAKKVKVKIKIRKGKKK